MIYNPITFSTSVSTCVSLSQQPRATGTEGYQTHLRLSVCINIYLYLHSNSRSLSRHSGFIVHTALCFHGNSQNTRLFFSRFPSTDPSASTPSLPISLQHAAAACEENRNQTTSGFVWVFFHALHAMNWSLASLFLTGSETIPNLF